jgi:2-oxoisovalerate dehydrogenase E2 component (dihydrolipoyl transacylase)
MSTAAAQFRLPDLGEGLTEAEIISWLVQPGDMVETDQPVAVVETAKATVELPCPCSGVVVQVHGAVGDVVEVGGVLLSVSTEPGNAAAERPAAVLVGSGAAPVPVRRARVLPPGSAAPPPAQEDAPPPRAAGRRRATAEKLTRAQREIPAATCWLEADAGGLLAAREALRASGVGVLALLARITVAGLLRFPELNGHYDGERDAVVPSTAVHLGIAVDTPYGLRVPVVRDAQDIRLKEFATEILRLTEAARAGSIEPVALIGSTMTLNNFGAFGVDGSVPILNHPEVAMLGVGRIARRPWVVGDELAVRPVVHLSVTFDHRVCDGAAPSGFLRHVADWVEQPLRLLGEA